MRSLPPEILCEIFVQAVLIPMSVKPMWRSSQEVIATPLRISHVCQTWRDIALSDGRLWSYLCTDSHCLKSARRARDFSTIFDTWVARSGGAPLNYAIELAGKGEPVGEAETQCALHIMTTLLEEHHRWGDIVFSCVRDYEFLDDLGPFHLTDMPMLTSLDLLCVRQSHFMLDFSQSSQLTRIDLDGNFSIAASNQSLRHLREPSKLCFLNCDKADDVIRSCQNFLSTAPFLEELVVDFMHGLSLLSSPLGDDRPVYPGLRRLMFLPYHGPEVFIDNVTLPSLDALVFRCAVQDGGRKLLRFLERSRPPLTYLGIHKCCAHEDNLIPCLKLLPTLECLRSAYLPVSTRFFRELTIPESGSGSVLCPLLEVLYLIGIKCLEDSAACAEALISMLESRARISKAFEEVSSMGFPVVHPSQLRDYSQESKEMILWKLEVGPEWRWRHSFSL